MYACYSYALISSSVYLNREFGLLHISILRKSEKRLEKMIGRISVTLVCLGSRERDRWCRRKGLKDGTRFGVNAGVDEEWLNR